MSGFKGFLLRVQRRREFVQLLLAVGQCVLGSGHLGAYELANRVSQPPDVFRRQLLFTLRLDLLQNQSSLHILTPLAGQIFLLTIEAFLLPIQELTSLLQ